MTAPLDIQFYETSTGAAPVKDWIKGFSKEDRKIIGKDLRHLQENWPIGTPLCKSMPRIRGCWELRTRTTRLKSLRIFFTIENGKTVLYHGFTKKDNQTAPEDIQTAITRVRSYRQANI